MLPERTGAGCDWHEVWPVRETAPHTAGKCSSAGDFPLLCEPDREEGAFKAAAGNGVCWVRGEI